MTLQVESSGSGPDLALLHGWGMNAAVWGKLAPALAPHFRVHCVNLPGYGASARCVPYTLETVTDALAAALPARVVVCGWSLGAQLALCWARRRPMQVERLVLIAATPRFIAGADWTAGMEVAVLDTFAAGIEYDAGAALRRFAALQAQGDANARDVLRCLREVLRHGTLDKAALAAGLRILKESDLRDSLQYITQPALMIHGTHDTVVPPAAGEYLRRALPHATLDIIDRAAHAPFVARRERVARSITEFCSGR